MKRILPLCIVLLFLVACGTDAAFIKASRDFHSFTYNGYKKYVIDGKAVPEWTDEERATLEKTFADYDTLLKKKED